ncbi:MAG: hypothetical protein JXA21_19180 [Anaerolineae bacterium]|nr:hypothetical protein [Anaerolineae bacterium]
MNPIVQNIHQGLPDQKYYEFVSRYLKTQGNDSLDDPFMIDLPFEEIDNFYVERKEVNRQILEAKCEIIVGKRGSGKTTLWQKRFSESKRRLHRGVLHLGLILDERNASEQDLGAFFAYHILKIYQERLLDSSSEIAPFLSTLICNLQWRNTFHHLYDYGCSRYQGKAAEGLLWGEEGKVRNHSSRTIASNDVLLEVCHFIGHPILDRPFGSLPAWPYKGVQIFLDLADDLPDETFLKLLQGIQQICALSSDGPDIKLYIRQDQTNLIERFGIYAQDIIYHLPPWSRDELHSLLAMRLGYYRNEPRSQSAESGIPETTLQRLREVLLACSEFENDHQLRVVFLDARIAGWRHGVPEAPNAQARVNAVIDYLFSSYNDKGQNILVLFLRALSDLHAAPDLRHQQLCELINVLEPITQSSSQYIDSNWLNIPANSLRYDDRQEFLQIIVNGALRAYTHPTNFDAPVHALKLARGLIAMCAGCWNDQITLPLNAHRLQEIVNQYWEEEKCDG